MSTYPRTFSHIGISVPDVQKAVTARRWPGSWHTMFIAVDRYGGRELDDEFEAELREHIGKYRLAGHDMEIEGADNVSLDIELLVCVSSGYFASDVERELLKVFGSVQLRDGTLGFFHPDNFSFSEPVMLSTLIARGMKLQGVKWIGLGNYDDEQRGRFRRLHDQSVDNKNPNYKNNLARQMSMPDSPPVNMICGVRSHNYVEMN